MSQIKMTKYKRAGLKQGVVLEEIWVEKRSITYITD